MQSSTYRKPPQSRTARPHHPWQTAANDSRYRPPRPRPKLPPSTPPSSAQCFRRARRHLTLASAAYRQALGILARNALRWLLWRVGVATVLLGGLWVNLAAPATG
jgi:hypothetical protein